MRYLLIFWAAPVALFWGWYYLSYYDINFGSIYLSRRLHDLVFELYGNILGIDPASIPSMIGNAFFIDTLVIGAIIAFRRRRAIAEWLETLKSRWAGSEEPQLPPAE
ncbi:MAG: DUF6105 family protein [Notoacmeibacter sp.]|nr:DUF6105 family protein [Notoacmeibacter sp.]